jgi:histidinol dehydrogenase
MPARLDARHKDFERQLSALLEHARAEEEDVSRAVSEIVAEVRARGDAALIGYSRRFDRVELTAETLCVAPSEISAAERAAPEAAKEALRFAAQRIEAYHGKQLPENTRFTDTSGANLGWRWGALDSVGLYVPGGTASYPSSVLMNAVPAKVAGVSRTVIVTPASGGTINPLTLAAASLAGVTEIYRIGGAQAVAALAYGTESIAPVDKIVGPGNAYVAAAKRQVFGRVGIDSIAGPSEILIIADSANDPAWIAADLLSQAEHDPSSQSVLITDDAGFADRVEAAVEAQLANLSRAAIAGRSWRDHGAVIVVADIADAAAIADRFAPEHLEIATADPEAIFAKVRHAGACFLGRYTPEAIGDYVAGPNHVLPTSRTARFSSGLSVLDFMKRTSVLALDSDALARLGPAALELARTEGLDAHGRSVAIRLNRT